MLKKKPVQVAVCIPMSLAAKLGSIVVHAEEATGEGGHQFDLISLRRLLHDLEVAAWMEALTRLGLVPVKR